MPETIRDGKGRGFLAAINKQGQLSTRATAVDQHTKSCADGQYFEATTGKTEMTDALEKGFIYLKNDQETTIIIDKVFVDLWASTGGDGNGATLNYYKNPDITGGTAIAPVNTNFAYPDELGVDLKALTTVSGGTVFWIGYVDPGSSVVVNEGKIAIPPGYSFCLSIIPETGNTSMFVNVNLAFYRLDLDLL